MISEDTHNMPSSPILDLRVDSQKQRYPFCIVWTPIPVITYLFPFIGHMGIATSTGIIRDFAGPYVVSEDRMAFGWPTKYWQLNYTKAKGKAQGWDSAVHEASEIYKERMHNLFCDNCHSHVARALNIMSYDNSNSWNMVKLALYMFIYGKYVSVAGFFKTWIPFSIVITIAFLIYSFSS
ncbi:transmembrane protein 222 [Copidosoma floridanum]|uniref:transmembrane protein 222 n=1 Tax=Copidosoma floridanum TaxID=29053 RepID=UPI0006C9BE30|nr:transmembrane protein 222 [Copidosoma floridanum]